MDYYGILYTVSLQVANIVVELSVVVRGTARMTIHHGTGKLAPNCSNVGLHLWRFQISTSLLSKRFIPMIHLLLCARTIKTNYSCAWSNIALFFIRISPAILVPGNFPSLYFGCLNISPPPQNRSLVDSTSLLSPVLHSKSASSGYVSNLISHSSVIIVTLSVQYWCPLGYLHWLP